MSVIQFLNHIHYKGTECPDEVNKSRWSGMLKWLETRKKLGEMIP